MKSLLHSKFVILALMAVVPAVASSYAECEQDAFIEEVNTAWVATNYPLIKQAITNRLAICTNDLLALGIQFEYYISAEVNYTNAKAAAQAYVLAVSNRVPEEINEQRDLMKLPLVYAREAMPTNLPSVPEQARTPAQIEYMHSTYSDGFPHVGVYQIVAGRVKLQEEGKLIWGVGFVDPEE